MSDHKIKIDKQALESIFLNDEPLSDLQLKQLYKVFNVIMIKYYSSYTDYAEDLRQYAVLAILNRRKDYDPSYSAYNYIFTVFRNEIGNNIAKLTKGSLLEDILSFREEVENESDIDFPPEILKYLKHLSGEVDFEYIRVAKTDVIDLTVFLKSFDRKDYKVPEFIQKNSNSTKILYKLLRDILNDE